MDKPDSAAPRLTNAADRKLFESGLLSGFKGGWYAAHRTLADDLKAKDPDYAAWLVKRGEKPPAVDIEELPPESKKS